MALWDFKNFSSSFRSCVYIIVVRMDNVLVNSIMVIIVLVMNFVWMCKFGGERFLILKDGVVNGFTVVFLLRVSPLIFWLL